MHKLAEFLCDETGATAIEYGLIVSATGLVLIAVMPALGSSLDSTFTSLSAGF